MHPGRQLAVLGLVFVVLYLLVFFAAGAEGSARDRLHPKLGLDLIGGTQVTYQASLLTNGQVPPRQNMEQARDIMESRVNALGVSEAEVVIEGDRNIVVSVAGKEADELKNIGQAAQMRFRKVLKATVDVAAAAANPPAASAAPSGSAKPSAGTTKAPNISGTSKPSTAPSTAASGGQGGGEQAPNPSASAPAPTATAAAPSASALPTPSASAAPVPGTAIPTRADVEKKVGPEAWAAASKLTDVPDLSQNPQAAVPLAKFGTLTGLEVNALTPEMQYNVPTISCKQLQDRPNGAIDDEHAKATACDKSGRKMYMDVAKVIGTDIASASPQYDQQQGQWVVSLDFKTDGQKKWADLTREAYNKTANDGCENAAGALGGDGQHCHVAVVLDKTVISAPEIQGVLTGQSQITGNFDAKSARQLADQIQYGALPVTFTAGQAMTVSPTLGTAQLKAGLLAAAIGMALVAIYAFFYYRLLGTVIFLSLILSGVLTYGALVFLGRATGFTLTLAGIAGFIVSLGVAADSFVIYFERLKDEIHEGRSPRSAVPRAWVRARRTIISANTITIMAAVVLYIVSIGAVKGFAAALGLATIIDLMVVFLFRHPIMTMFANTKAFLSPRVSGLGKVLPARTKSDEAPRTSRAKEA
ncbi:protein translocase subunit SecD [Krasilnikovia sp. MM14-A1259]|uniref:protein translocase subunit SecD n=1 Tax=Krasilnikovia sp. MM14-A1259 TaxID=3373539 RepID=UPI00399CB9B8